MAREVSFSTLLHDLVEGEREGKLERDEKILIFLTCTHPSCRFLLHGKERSLG